MSVTKEDRLQLRVDEASKRRLTDAARQAHLSVSAFVLQNALLAADEILADRDVLVLSAEASAAFSEALSRPAEVNQRLAAALGRPPAFGWLD